MPTTPARGIRPLLQYLRRNLTNGSQMCLMSFRALERLLYPVLESSFLHMLDMHIQDHVLLGRIEALIFPQRTF